MAMAQDDLKLKMVPTYSLGKKAEWRVQDAELIEIDGAEYVQLKKGKANHHGFSRLVFAKRGLPDQDKSWTLSTSIGYKELQELRTKWQVSMTDLAQAAADLHRYNPPIWQKLAQINALPLAAVVRQLMFIMTPSQNRFFLMTFSWREDRRTKNQGFFIT